jgi:hypothetical protein
VSSEKSDAKNDDKDKKVMLLLQAIMQIQKPLNR